MKILMNIYMRKIWDENYNGYVYGEYLRWIICWWWIIDENIYDRNEWD